MRLASTLAIFLAASFALASDIVVQVPAGSVVVKAVAQSAGDDAISGVIDAQSVRFKNVSPQKKYDVALTLKDHTILQGVNFGWYSLEPAKADAQPLTDDDRQQIGAILKDVLSFYNKNEILILQGNHDRAVALVQLIRDKAFHSDSGDEVIWHIELWYFKNQHGGWEKVQQANKIVRRERFPSQKEFEGVVKPIRWTPELGGLRVAKGEEELSVKLPEPATMPSKSQ